MASKITTVLELLSDGKWHTIEQIQKEAKISKKQVSQITEFLRDYNFIQTNEAQKKIKLNKTMQEFLSQHATA